MLPDLKGAVIARLQLCTAITTLTGSAPSAVVRGRLPDNVKQPAYYAIVQDGVGGPGEVDGGLMVVRVDIHCYGPTDLNAHELWRVVDWYLCTESGVARGFTAAQTRVSDVISESGPLRLVDPDNGWPRTVGSYLFTYTRKAVA